MRHKSPFTWIALALSALLISTVLSQSGSYDLSWWTVNNGGATFSTGNGYSLGATIGQSDAATLSGNGYTLLGGFWSSNTGPTNLRSYLPSVVKALPTSPPIQPVPCNEKEDNAGKNKANPFPGMGKTCYGDFNAPSNDEDDWYWVSLTAGQRIKVLLSHMQAGDDFDPYLYLPDGVTHGGESHNQGFVDDSFTYLVPASGTYYIHLHAFVKNANSHTYWLSVTLQ